MLSSKLIFLEKEKLDLKIEIETRDLNEVKEVLKAGKVHRIMLDNFSCKDLKTAVKLINGKRNGSFWKY